MTRLFLDPIEDRLEAGAATAINAHSLEGGGGALVEFLDFLDVGIALDEREPALGGRAEFVEFAEDEPKFAVAHGAGGVDGDDDVAGAGGADGGEVEPVPDVFFVRRHEAVVVPAQAGEKAGEEGAPRDFAAAGFFELPFHEAAHGATQFFLNGLAEGDAQALAFFGRGELAGTDILAAHVVGCNVEVPAFGSLLRVFIAFLVASSAAANGHCRQGVVFLFGGFGFFLQLGVDVFGGHTEVVLIHQADLWHLHTELDEHEVRGVINRLVPESVLAVLAPVDVAKDAVHDLVGEDEDDFLRGKCGAEGGVHINVITIRSHSVAPAEAIGIHDWETRNGRCKVGLAQHELDAGLHDFAWEIFVQKMGSL